MGTCLDNPVYYALLTGDQHFALGNSLVKYFPEAVSPFAGFYEQYERGFSELHDMLPPGRKILYATRNLIEAPEGWDLLHHIPGSQFLFQGKWKEPGPEGVRIEPLLTEHIEQMVNLAALTKPGPFNERTIEFGSYYGIFDGSRLVAMTGQRLHIYDYSEVSAVCTHPDHTGKGYANALLKHQVNIIIGEGRIPILHVRSDNAGAISIYEKMGFVYNGVMNFYLLRRTGL